MVRLSSRDASLLMDLLEQTDLSPDQRLKILDGADEQVRQIGKALLCPNQRIEDEDIREVVEQIHLWTDETKKIEAKIKEKQRQFA
jgi:predicted nuclease of restriction endonuclease-like RecB superfamily